ncbi:hypothetical protein BGX38DRAFT_570575 [Terfezia claveryi]|nr:hypothetical protein BGX38DRAFT_611993 [Terfezia claveryi]KAF8458473.1 hypothetical protein BGX38DRAFT_570575 [Terfezia claveryi]
MLILLCKTGGGSRVMRWRRRAEEDNKGTCRPLLYHRQYTKACMPGPHSLWRPKRGNVFIDAAPTPPNHLRRTMHRTTANTVLVESILFRVSLHGGRWKARPNSLNREDASVFVSTISCNLRFVEQNGSHYGRVQYPSNIKGFGMDINQSSRSIFLEMYKKYP